MSDALDAAGAAVRDAAKRVDRRIPSHVADEGRYVPAGKAAIRSPLITRGGIRFPRSPSERPYLGL